MGRPTAGTSVGTGVGVITLNRWYHVAFTSEGAGLNGRIYINGVLQAGPTNYTNPTGTSSVFNLGRNNVAAGDWSGLQGFMSNFRFVSGQRLYTSNFIPQGSPLTRTTYSTDGGTSFLTITGTTQLLALQSNRFIDNSANNFTLVGTSSPSVQSFHPFSISAVYTIPAAYGGSGFFNGTTDYLSIPAPNGSPLDISGGANFTIEAWFYATNTATMNIWARGGINGTQNAQYWANLNNGTLQWGFGNGGAGGIAPGITNVQYNCWNHFAIVLVGTTFTPYLNGVAYATVALTFTIATNVSNPSLWIGGAADPGVRNLFYGYITGFRLVKGTAVYTANFALPTAPATAIFNANILLTFANAGIYDAAAQNYAITQSTAQLNNSIYKWPPASMRFNGSTDYLTMPIINFGSGATASSFTAEGWFYTTTPAADQTIISQYQSSSNGWAVRLSGSKIVVGLNGDPFNITGTTTILANTWYYFAFSGSVGSWKLFMGTGGTTIQEGATYTGSVNLGNNAGGGIQVGRISNVVYFNGYIQDIRITRDVVRYTSPPLVPNETFAISGSNYLKIEYLVVAGGGGGGYSVGGGGGAGGLISGNNLDVVPGSSYSITIGGGGIAGTVGSTPGGTGSPSIFGLFTANGGGAGGGSGVTAIATGFNGGSGGGGGFPSSGTVNGGLGTTGQGNNGGTGVHVPGQYAYSGGGGGAGAVGGNGGPGAGGSGIQTSITGTATFYAGGGGGGGSGAGAGGNGGGGSPGVDGTANTGGGGGGSNVSTNGRIGGSGVVIIAYPSIFPDISFIDSGLAYTQPTRSGYKVYRFTGGTGTIRW